MKNWSTAYQSYRVKLTLSDRKRPRHWRYKNRKLLCAVTHYLIWWVSLTHLPHKHQLHEKWRQNPDLLYVWQNNDRIFCCSFHKYFGFNLVSVTFLNVACIILSPPYCMLSGVMMMLMMMMFAVSRCCNRLTTDCSILCVTFKHFKVRLLSPKNFKNRFVTLCFCVFFYFEFTMIPSCYCIKALVVAKKKSHINM